MKNTSIARSKGMIARQTGSSIGAGEMDSAGIGSDQVFKSVLRRHRETDGIAGNTGSGRGQAKLR